MMINHNISFDTINCDCCKDDPDAKVSSEIMDIINEGLIRKKKEFKVIGYVKRKQV